MAKNRVYNVADGYGNDKGSGIGRGAGEADEALMP